MNWLWQPLPTGPAKQTLTPGLVTDADTFFAPTVTVGAVTLQPGLLTDADTFFAPRLKYTVTASLLTDGDTFIAPSVARGAVTLLPSLLSDADTFFAPTVSRGAVALTPPLFTDGDTFFAPSIGFRLSASRLTDGDTFPIPLLVSITQENLYPTSEQAPDELDAVSISSDAATAPDSTMTAEVMTEDTSLNFHGSRKNFDPTIYVTTTTWYTASSYVKLLSGTRTFFLGFTGDSDYGFAIFDLSTGDVVEKFASFSGDEGTTDDFVVAGAVDVGGGYYRVWVSFRVEGSVNSLLSTEFFFSDGTGNAYTGDGTSSVAFWGHQINRGVGPATYIKTPEDQNLDASLLSDADTFFAPAVIRGAVTLSPALFANGQTFFAPTVSRGTINLSPSLLSDGDTFFAPAVSVGVATLLPGRISDGDTFFAPTVAGGTVTLLPSLFTDGDSFFSPVVGRGAVTLTPSLFTDGDAFFSPTLTQSQNLLPSKYNNVQTFFAPVVSRGVRNLSPSLLTNADTFFSPTVAFAGELFAGILTDPDIFFPPTVAPGTVTLPAHGGVAETSPSQPQTFALGADDIETGAPTVGRPALTENFDQAAIDNDLLLFAS